MFRYLLAGAITMQANRFVAYVVSDLAELKDKILAASKKILALILCQPNASVQNYEFEATPLKELPPYIPPTFASAAELDAMAFETRQAIFDAIEWFNTHPGLSLKMRKPSKSGLRDSSVMRVLADSLQDLQAIDSRNAMMRVASANNVIDLQAILQEQQVRLQELCKLSVVAGDNMVQLKTNPDKASEAA